MKNTEKMSDSGANPLSIVHIDPHPLFRFGTRKVLDSHSSYTIVGECGTAHEALRLVASLRPSLLLLELALPDKSGIEVIRDLQATHLKTKVLVFSGFHDEATVRQALHAGANGYLFKSSTPEQLLTAIATVDTGKLLTLPSHLLHLQDQPTKQRKDGSKNGHFNIDPLGLLSKREREVFYLLADGHPNRVIAQQLFISPRTVETHRARVIKKLGFESTADLIRYAIRNNLMPL